MNSQSLQQQSTICIIVEQCCEDEQSYDELYSQIVTFVQTNLKYFLIFNHTNQIQYSKEVRAVVDTIKKIIKNKKTDSPGKVLALRLLNSCLMQAQNEEFLVYTEKKIMRRLQILARFKKEQNDIQKGALLFGKTFNNMASADFLKLLLLYIKNWAAHYQTYPSTQKQSEMNKIYQLLVKEHIHFPDEQQVVQTLHSNYQTDHFPRGTETSQSVQLSSYQAPPSINQNNFLASQTFQTTSSQKNANNISQTEPSTGRQSTISIKSNQPVSTMSREEQLEIAKEIKMKYKKLYEYQKSAKLAQELLAAGGGQIDDEFLTQMRQQLFEGKDFAEQYVQMLMETSFTIKDKEEKIDKILGIIAEIGTELDKVLALKPFTPRSLQKMKKQFSEDSKGEKDWTPQYNPQEQLNSNQNQPTPVSQSQRKFELPNDSQIQPSGFQSERLKSNSDNKNKNGEALNSEVPFNKDIFKTNFAINNTSSASKLHGTQFWTNNDNSNGKSHDFANFNASQPISFQKMNTVLPKSKTSLEHEEEKSCNVSMQQVRKSVPVSTSSKGATFGACQMNQQLSRPPEMSQPSPDSNVSSDDEEGAKLSPEKQMGKFPSPKKNDKLRIDQKNNRTGSNIKQQQPQPQPSSSSKDLKQAANFFDFNGFSNNDNKVNIQQESHINSFQFDVPQAPPTNETQNSNTKSNIPVIETMRSFFSPVLSKAVSQQQQEAPQTSSNHNNNNSELLSKIEQLTKECQSLTLKNQQLQTQLGHKQQFQEEAQLQLDKLEQEKRDLSAQKEDLVNQNKGLKKFEYLYEEEKFSKIELSNETARTSGKMEEYKIMMERLEQKLNKRNHEYDQLNERMEGLLDRKDQEIQKLKQQLEEVVDENKREIHKLRTAQQEQLAHNNLEIQTLSSQLRDQNLKADQSYRQYQQDIEAERQKYNQMELDYQQQIASLNQNLTQRQSISKPAEIQHFKIIKSKSPLKKGKFSTQSIPQFEIFENQKLEPTPDKQGMLADYVQATQDIELEEMYCDVPSGDSDKESSPIDHNDDKWDFVRASQDSQQIIQNTQAANNQQVELQQQEKIVKGDIQAKFDKEEVKEKSTEKKPVKFDFDFVPEEQPKANDLSSKSQNNGFFGAFAQNGPPKQEPKIEEDFWSFSVGPTIQTQNNNVSETPSKMFNFFDTVNDHRHSGLQNQLDSGKETQQVINFDQKQSVNEIKSPHNNVQEIPKDKNQEEQKIQAYSQQESVPAFSSQDKSQEFNHQQENIVENKVDENQVQKAQHSNYEVQDQSAFEKFDNKYFDHQEIKQQPVQDDYQVAIHQPMANLDIDPNDPFAEAFDSMYQHNKPSFDMKQDQVNIKYDTVKHIPQGPPANKISEKFGTQGSQDNPSQNQNTYQPIQHLQSSIFLTQNQKRPEEVKSFSLTTPIANQQQQMSQAIQQASIQNQPESKFDFKSQNQVKQTEASSTQEKPKKILFDFDSIEQKDPVTVNQQLFNETKPEKFNSSKPEEKKVAQIQPTQQQKEVSELDIFASFVNEINTNKNQKQFQTNIGSHQAPQQMDLFNQQNDIQQNIDINNSQNQIISGQEGSSRKRGLSQDQRQSNHATPKDLMQHQQQPYENSEQNKIVSNFQVHNNKLEDQNIVPQNQQTATFNNSPSRPRNMSQYSPTKQAMNQNIHSNSAQQNNTYRSPPQQYDGSIQQQNQLLQSHQPVIHGQFQANKGSASPFIILPNQGGSPGIKSNLSFNQKEIDPYADHIQPTSTNLNTSNLQVGQNQPYMRTASNQSYQSVDFNSHLPLRLPSNISTSHFAHPNNTNNDPYNDTQSQNQAYTSRSQNSQQQSISQFSQVQNPVQQMIPHQTNNVHQQVQPIAHQQIQNNESLVYQQQHPTPNYQQQQQQTPLNQQQYNVPQTQNIHSNYPQQLEIQQQQQQQPPLQNQMQQQQVQQNQAQSIQNQVIHQNPQMQQQNQQPVTQHQQLQPSNQHQLVQQQQQTNMQQPIQNQQSQQPQYQPQLQNQQQQQQQQQPQQQQQYQGQDYLIQNSSLPSRKESAASMYSNYSGSQMPSTSTLGAHIQPLPHNAVESYSQTSLNQNLNQHPSTTSQLPIVTQHQQLNLQPTIQQQPLLRAPNQSSTSLAGPDEFARQQQIHQQQQNIMSHRGSEYIPQRSLNNSNLINNTSVMNVSQQNIPHQNNQQLHPAYQNEQVQQLNSAQNQQNQIPINMPNIALQQAQVQPQHQVQPQIQPQLIQQQPQRIVQNQPQIQVQPQNQPQIQAQQIQPQIQNQIQPISNIQQQNQQQQHQGLPNQPQIQPQYNQQQFTTYQPQVQQQPILQQNNMNPQAQQYQQQQPIQQQQIARNNIQVVNQPPVNAEFNRQQYNTQAYNGGPNSSQMQKETQIQQDPQILLQNHLQGFFKKSLLTNKSILYEDNYIQLGVICDFKGPQARVRIYFNSRPTQQTIQIDQISFRPMLKPIGCEVIQSKDHIENLSLSAQEPLDIIINVSSYQLSILTYALNYRLNGAPTPSIPIKLPVVLLKFCHSPGNIDPASFVQCWDVQCGQGGEYRQQFSIDLAICKSLSAMKDSIQLGKATFCYVDGVEQARNIVCCATQFSLLSINALAKITMTATGVGCEVVARSDDKGADMGKFAKFITANIIEIIGKHTS